MPRLRDGEKVRSQTNVEFSRSKEQLFDRWCPSQKVDKNHDRLRQLILIEESKRCIHSDVRTFIDEQKAETLEEGARLADELWLRHKVNFMEKPRQFHTPPARVPPPSVPRWLGNQRSRQNDGGHPKQNPANNYANRFSSSWSR